MLLITGLNGTLRWNWFLTEISHCDLLLPSSICGINGIVCLYLRCSIFNQGWLHPLKFWMLFKSYGWQLVDKALHLAHKHYTAEVFYQIAVESNLQDPVISEVCCACKSGFLTIDEARGFCSKGGEKWLQVSVAVYTCGSKILCFLRAFAALPLM